MKVLILSNMYPTPKIPRGSFVKTQEHALRQYADVSIVVENGEHGSQFAVMRKYLRIALLTFWQSVVGSYDVVHAHYVFPTGFIGLIPKWLRGWKLVVTAHRGDIVDMPKRSRVHFWLTRMVLNQCDAVVAVSEELRDMILDMFHIPESKISVIDMGVDLSRFHAEGKDAARRQLGLPEESVIAVSVCYSFERKGGPNILKAVCEAPAGSFDCLKLFFISLNDGTAYQPYIREKGGERLITFLGLQPPEQVALWLRAADLFILASSSEGLPIAVLEAMASGCAIIATRVGGVPQVITDRKDGLLIDPDDVDAIRRSFAELIQNLPLRSTLAREATERARAFDASLKARQLCELYSTLLTR